MVENSEGYFLEKGTMEWFRDCYLPSEEDKKNPLVSPELYENFAGIPSSLVITAEYDSLRDEGENYAKLLADAGVEVECVRFDGVIHGFVSMAAVINKGEQALQKAGKTLSNVFQSSKVSL